MKWIIGLIVVIAIIVLGVVLYKNKYPSTNNNNNTTSSSSQPVSGTAVTIDNFSFTPSDLQVNAGDTVTFNNQDSATHTVVSDSGLFTSDSIANGGSFSYTFSTSGTYAYHCSIHPSMTGRIEVK